MYEGIKNAEKRVVGLKQVLRELRSENVQKIYLAQDADEIVKARVKRAAGLNTEVVAVPSMERLGHVCGIKVRAACAAVLKK